VVKYRTSFWVWGLLTVGLTATYLVWEHHRATPFSSQDDLLGEFLRPTADPLLFVGTLLATAALAGLMSIPAGVVYAVTVVVAHRLARRPGTEQAADYDDGPPPPPAG